MSVDVARSSHDEEATSGTSSHDHLSSWISHWTKKSSRPALATTDDNSMLACYRGGHVDLNSRQAQSALEENDFTRPGKGPMKFPEREPTRIKNDSFTMKTEDFLNKIDGTSHTVHLSENLKKRSALITDSDHDFGQNTMSLALTMGKRGTAVGFDLLHGNNSNAGEKHGVNTCPGQNSVDIRSSSSFKAVGSPSLTPLPTFFQAEASEPVVVFEKHLSNDSFTCFDRGHCKHQKVSTLLFHDKKRVDDVSFGIRQSDGHCMQHDPSMNKNYLPFFLNKKPDNAQGLSSPELLSRCRNMSEISQRKHCNGWQAVDVVPCSVRNVETMRICTMVDSMENSSGGTPKISKRAHRILYTKETCVDMTKAHQFFRESIPPAHNKNKTAAEPFNLFHGAGYSGNQGVKIQPLWTSSDSDEKETTVKPSTSRTASRNESSAETDYVQVEDPENQRIHSGVASFPLNENNAVNEDIVPDEVDSSTAKARSKRPITEIPDINVDVNEDEVPRLKPAVSSTDGTERSTSRVRSLDTKHLFSYNEQNSGAGLNGGKDRPSTDPNNRWIKRLKLNSSNSIGVGTKCSEVGESSSHEKFSLFFNRIMKSNKASLTTMLSNQTSKENMALEESMELLRNSGPSSTSTDKANPWIQRWCSRSTSLSSKNPEPLVICEPHSLKLGNDELGKKQFPSIAAMALMGKAMNGFRPCEFSKRGPVVVWNTKDY